MPLVVPTFCPPRFLRNGHLQTILPRLLRRRLGLRYRRERLELDDGDFLDLDWSRAAGRDGGRVHGVVILSHGLEASAEADYIRGTAAAVNAAGWDALAWTFRGCGQDPNRLPRFYHSGETGDLRRIIRHVEETAAERPARIALVGFSLGGNLTLKHLGEAAPAASVVAAAAVSVPIDLASSARALDERPANRLYLRRFLHSLIRKVENKGSRFAEAFDLTGVRAIRTFQEFDDRFTAPLHGFRDAADYWARSSARQFLGGIRVPTLLVNARDDPFLAPESFPFPEAEANPHFFLDAPDHGGHVGFLDFAAGSPIWTERRIARFLTEIGGVTGAA